MKVDDPMPTVAKPPPIGPIEAVHPLVARALRAKSGMERLRLAHETWELVRDQLTAYLAAQNPGWRPEEVRRHVAHRLLRDPGGAAPIPR